MNHHSVAGRLPSDFGVCQMDLKAFLTEKGLKLIQDPRVMKLVQDERFMKAVMGAFQLRGKLQETFEERVEEVAKSLNLATKAEVRELKRAMRKLEDELERARNAQKKSG